MWFAVVLVGCGSVSVEGRVVDGLNGQPIAGPYRVKAKAVSAEAAISCQFFDADVSAEGKFVLDQLCTGTAYTLETDRDDVWLVDQDQVPEGGWAQPTDLVAWRVPKGAGLYKLSNGQLEALKTAADVKSEKILGSEERVLYPAAIPNAVTVIGPEDYLVLVGKAAVEELKIEPLVASGQRKFGDATITWTMEPWLYVGVKFTDDTTFERVPATVDAAKVVDKERGERKARFVSGSALAAGRYAMLKEGDKRLYVFDFGAGQGTPAPTTTPAEPAPGG
ncbi:MAG: hypothetical protein ABMA64_06110 [Myxococcota bacterium]